MILVTGGTGLVGSHLLYALLTYNKEVTAIYRSENKLEKVKQVFSYYTDDYETLFNIINWVKADITDITSLTIAFSTEITHVYHCAALVTFNPKRYLEMRKVNIEGTANIVNFCIANKIKKLCHVSSIATLGNSTYKKEITEENEWIANDNCYAITKHGAEMEVWRGSQEGIDTIIVNPGVILGGGFFNEGSGQIFTKSANSFPFFTDGVTGFVGVKDVALAMLQLMDSTIVNERFILVAENCNFKSVLFKIADAFDKKRPAIKIGTFGLACFWRLESVLSRLLNKEPLLTKSSAKASCKKEYFSSEKINKALDYKFETIETVITETCKQYTVTD